MGNILKMADCRAKRTKNWELRSYVRHYVRYYSCLIQFSLMSFSALCKILDVNIFKRVLLPQFSSKFNQTFEKACNPGQYRPLLFLPNCKHMALSREVTSSANAIIHKSILVSSGKRSSRLSRSLGLRLRVDIKPPRFF